MSILPIDIGGCRLRCRGCQWRGSWNCSLDRYNPHTERSIYSTRPAEGEQLTWMWKKRLVVDMPIDKMFKLLRWNMYICTHIDDYKSKIVSIIALSTIGEPVFYIPVHPACLQPSFGCTRWSSILVYEILKLLRMRDALQIKTQCF